MSTVVFFQRTQKTLAQKSYKNSVQQRFPVSNGVLRGFRATAPMYCRMQEAWQHAPAEPFKIEMGELKELCYFSHLVRSMTHLDDAEIKADLTVEGSARLTEQEHKLVFLKANRVTSAAGEDFDLSPSQRKRHKELAGKYAVELQHRQWTVAVEEEDDMIAISELYLLKLEPADATEARSILKWLRHGNPYLQKAAAAVMRHLEGRCSAIETTTRRGGRTGTDSTLTEAENSVAWRAWKHVDLISAVLGAKAPRGYRKRRDPRSTVPEVTRLLQKKVDELGLCCSRPVAP